MKIRTGAAALAGLAALAAAPVVPAQVATVNGVTIPQQRMDFFVRSFVAQGRQDTPELRNLVREELINRELLAQEAVRRGLNKTPDVATEIDLRRMDVLINALMRKLHSEPSEDAIRKEYDRVKNQLGAREYKVKHILVKNEDDAKEIISQIKGGASFEKIAGERSEDTGTRSRGGELDWGPASRYVKPFGDAITRLKKGEMTETPVKTNFGWHVIRLDDERALKVPPFEQVRGNLRQQIHQRTLKEAYEKVLADLRAKAKIQ